MKKEDFLKRVLAFAHENHLWEKGDGILAAVSGGPDSLGLLLFLKDIVGKRGNPSGLLLREPSSAESGGRGNGLCGIGVPPFPYSLL